MIVDILTGRERTLSPDHVSSLLELLPAAEVDRRYDYSTTGPYTYPPERYWTTLWFTRAFFEYPTQELVEGIGDRIMRRKLGCTPLRLLEMAAGSGALGYYIDAYLNHNNFPVKTALVDDFSWTLPGTSDSIAQKIDALEALDQFQPHVVLGAWLPAESTEDWTKSIRATPSVEEYLLIGENEGHGMMSAWGLEYEDFGNSVRVQQPEYVDDGFSREDLTALAGFQRRYLLGKMNDPKNSATVSFQRNA